MLLHSLSRIKWNGNGEMIYKLIQTAHVFIFTLSILFDVQLAKNRFKKRT